MIITCLLILAFGLITKKLFLAILFIPFAYVISSIFGHTITSKFPTRIERFYYPILDNSIKLFDGYILFKIQTPNGKFNFEEVCFEDVLFTFYPSLREGYLYDVYENSNPILNTLFVMKPVKRNIIINSHCLPSE